MITSIFLPLWGEKFYLWELFFQGFFGFGLFFRGEVCFWVFMGRDGGAMKNILICLSVRSYFTVK